jgi:hypothetical protein
MLYASGENPGLRDRIINEEGRVGTLLDITKDPGRIEISELIVRWDDGVVGLRYYDAANFRLISRACLHTSAFGPVAACRP